MEYKYHDYRKKNNTRYKKIPANHIIKWIENNFEFKTRKNNTEYCICDPFSGDTKFKFNINPENGVCHSWHGDDWAGPINPKTGKRNCSIINFVRIYKKYTYAEALSDILGGSVDLQEYVSQKEKSIEESDLISVIMPDGVSHLSGSNDKQALVLKKWLKSRGYDDDQIYKADISYLGMDVFWPYYEFDELVYWQSRSRLNKRFNFPPEEIYDENGKLIGKTEHTKDDFLYGFDFAEPASYLIITEAIFDQNTLGEQCLATGGCDLTNNQYKKIKLLGPKKGIILSPDNDNAGIRSILTNVKRLDALNVPIYFSIPPSIKIEEDGKIKTSKDWNEVGQIIGFNNVRKIHDENIKKCNMTELIKLKKKIIGPSLL